jgi:ATP-dependent helicase/nuclease subunit A
VALTRAADRLVIAGSRGQVRAPEGCWYQLVESALKPDAIEENDGEGPVLRWRKAAPTATAAPEVASASVTAHQVPAWLRRAAPAIPHAAPPLAPSALSPAFHNAGALARGRIVHRLLQALPALPAERRAEAARRHLARAKEFDGAARDAIAREVLAVLGDARFAPLFESHARAEVPIVGSVSRGERKVSGQVDRLAITATEVLIAEYKSDRIVPRRIEDIPESYRGQLALYREVLRTLYPNHHVRAVLVWTAGPALTELPDDALDRALSRLGSA